MNRSIVNIVFAGLGGQGVLKASDIMAETAFRAGVDVKKAEIHGMSQRGGSVTSDVRFGDADVLSPMVSEGEADYLVVLDASQIDNNRAMLRSGGVLIEPGSLDPSVVATHPRSLNVALLGVLSTHLDFDEATWLAAIRANLPSKVHEINETVFRMRNEPNAQ